MRQAERKPQPPPGSLRCSKCKRDKPEAAFYRSRSAGARPGGLAYYCRLCSRLASARAKATDSYREWLSAYLARPEVKDRKAASDRKRSEAKRARQRAYRQTPLGKLFNCRQSARRRLRRAADPARAKRLEALIALYDAEIARLKDPDRHVAPASPRARWVCRVPAVDLGGRRRSP